MEIHARWLLVLVLAVGAMEELLVGVEVLVVAERRQAVRPKGALLA